MSKTPRRKSSSKLGPDHDETQPLQAGSIPDVEPPNCLAEVLCELEKPCAAAPFPRDLQHKKQFRELVTKVKAGCPEYLNVVQTLPCVSCMPSSFRGQERAWLTCFWKSVQKE